MEAVKSLLVVIWNWTSSNRDALLVEGISIALTAGLIAALVRWRERQRWAATRRRVALDIGDSLEKLLGLTARLSGVTSSEWSHVLEREMTMTLRHSRTVKADFIEEAYRRHFRSGFEGAALIRVSLDEWETFTKAMDDILTDLDRNIDLAMNLFSPQVTAALLRIRDTSAAISAAVRRPQEQDVDCQRLGWMTKDLALTGARALRMTCEYL